MQTNHYFTKTRWLVTIILLTTLCIYNVWGATYTITFKTSGSDPSQAISTSETITNIVSEGSSYIKSLNTCTKCYGPAKSGLKLGTGSATGTFKFTLSDALAAKTIRSVTIKNVKYGSDSGNITGTATGTNTGSLGSATKGNDLVKDYTASSTTKITTIQVATSSTRAYISQIIIETIEASCSSATPSATGAAALNGSFNMTSTTSAIGVSTSSWNPGSNCSWSDYGFVWSDGTTTTTPTVSNNKVQVGTSGTGTSWTGSVTPSGSTTPTSWTTGHTYYVRAYGKNNNGSATYAYGNAWSFTPRSVTFKANGGTGSDKEQYVQGGVSTALTSNTFTRTGYNFNGWNTDADGTSGTGYTNGQSVSLSGNLTLFAKWTAKQCTVSFDIEGGTGTITNVTATYGQEMPSKEGNLPTKTGYDFGGFWDGDNGTGTQYYNADGTSKINWNKDVTAAQTLYAKWTVKSYSVTWKVNKTNYSAGGSTSVDHGSRVATLPTAPDHNDYCGDKFMGWTTDEVYVHNTSPLFTSAGSAPVADGPQIFYAVFADYGE